MIENKQQRPILIASFSGVSAPAPHSATNHDSQLAHFLFDAQAICLCSSVMGWRRNTNHDSTQVTNSHREGFTRHSRRIYFAGADNPKARD